MRRSMGDTAVSFKFGGDIEDVDIQTFTGVMLDYAEVVRASSRVIDPNARIDIRISAVNPDCLEAVLALAKEGFGALIANTGDAVAYLANVVTVAGGVYTLFRWSSKHGGVSATEPKNGDTEVVARDGERTVVSHSVADACRDPSVKDSVRGTFRRLERDDSVESVSFGLDGEPPVFKADRDDFAGLALADGLESPDERESNELMQNVVVLKPYLSASPKHAWRVVWHGIPVSAKVVDEDFLTHLDEYSFTVGTGMTVDLRILQRKMKDSPVYENKAYNITKVHGVTSIPHQQHFPGME